ncbi:MAG: SSS family solute:Na+ symporter [Planctomycetota bacterium]|jgi:SSS family solute:Na+ symporter
MQLATLDWAIIGIYVAFALGTGILLSRRASANVDEFFLSGRNLPWWIAGTSMIATSFAADTPLVVTGWVRDFGIWKNWLWWCYAGSGFMTVFLFARYWRRGEIMTTAELSELRYGGSGAKVLRGFLGFYHAFIKNELILSWVLLAAIKIMAVLIGGDPLTSILILCAIALVYSTLAGLWGVVMTDMLQFVMSIGGAVFLAVIAWRAVEGIDGLNQMMGGSLPPETLSLLPVPDPVNFWTTSVAAVCVYLGVAWWASDNVDGGSIAVQRISAAKDERHGMLAMLWFNVGHYALRPWPWILVALASIPLLPTREIVSPTAGVVTSIEAGVVELATLEGPVSIAIEDDGPSYWQPVPIVEPESEVEAGAAIARTDSERAYPAMMAKFLPVGLLGLVVASLLAAFMSTIDTHVNLASSFFVNDIYRRFVKSGATPKHYVLVARLAGAGTLALGGFVAWKADSLSQLFEFFLTLMAGVGPVYALRWLWWRIQASTEITAMLSSCITAVVLTTVNIDWPSTPLSPAGELSSPGRICLVVACSLICILISLAVTKKPEPANLVEFYRRIRPLGFWGPVRALAPEVTVRREAGTIAIGVVSGLTATYGAMFGVGLLLLGRTSDGLLSFAISAVGTVATVWSLSRLRE